MGASAKQRQPFAFLQGGGEMGERMRAFDWASTPLGAPQTWPTQLKTAVRLLLSTRHPMFIWWGPQLIQFYNDAYRLSIGPEHHPRARGQPGRECWEEVWDLIGPQVEHVMQGRGAIGGNARRLASPTPTVTATTSWPQTKRTGQMSRAREIPSLRIANGRRNRSATGQTHRR